MNLSSLTEISTPLWYIKSLTIAQQSENSIAFAVAHVSQLRSLHALQTSNSVLLHLQIILHSLVFENVYTSVSCLSFIPLVPQ